MMKMRSLLEVSGARGSVTEKVVCNLFQLYVGSRRAMVLRRRLAMCLGTAISRNCLVRNTVWCLHSNFCSRVMEQFFNFHYWKCLLVSKNL